MTIFDAAQAVVWLFALLGFLWTLLALMDWLFSDRRALPQSIRLLVKAGHLTDMPQTDAPQGESTPRQQHDDLLEYRLRALLHQCRHLRTSQGVAEVYIVTDEEQDPSVHQMVQLLARDQDHVHLCTSQQAQALFARDGLSPEP